MAAGVENVNPQFIRIHLHLHIVGLRQHCHGGRGGMDAPLGFRFRHPLYPVDAPLVLQPAERPLALNLKHYLMKPAQIRRVGIHHIHPPVLQLGIAVIQPVQIAGEQTGFLPAGAGPHLYDNIPLVVGVFGQ